MQKIVLAIDSYKGCLDSLAVERAASEGIRSFLPEVEVCCVPIADGGEGMLEVMVELTHGHKVMVTVHDPLMRLVEAYYGVLGDGKTAVVEMAQAGGLTLLSSKERDPSLTTTYGVGEILRAVLEAGYERIVIGLGGSATNDGGVGMMQALGAHFYDDSGHLIDYGCGKYLESIVDFDLRDFYSRIKGVCFLTACDVDNVFCGPDGAAYVFAPQKGANEDMVKKLDAGLLHYAQLVEEKTGVDVKTLPGAGAAGGLGGCLSAFFHSPLHSGVDLILEQMDFRKLSAGASLLVTGEGKADRQTLMGKVPAGVLKVGRELGIDVALLAGAVEDADYLKSAGFVEVVAASPEKLPLIEAMEPNRASKNITSAAEILLRNYVKRALL